MHKAISVFFTLIVTLSLLGIATAAPKKAMKTHIDTSKVEVKKFNPDSLKKYSGDKDFNYKGTNETDGQPSLWTRFWNWLWNAISDWLDRIPHSGIFIKYFLLALAIILLAYIVFKSLDIDPIRLWRGEARKTEIPYHESLENIHEINFDAEIERAVSQHNYRLAVRLLYLKCLKQLSDNNLIQWQIDKTNLAYFYELKDPAQKQSFGSLTRQFEYVWYGNFAVNRQTFDSINQLFQSFKKQLP